ncbi:MAG: T9SS type A sorting domain-containing protein [Flavobacteriales bacterium]|nr:T9SS type A sorting domain-containing protein [Flavobacteriales bacterium]
MSKNQLHSDKALWTVQLDADPTSIGTGLAAVVWTGTEFWVAEWSSNVMYTANQFGASTGTFTITGLTGTRCFTTDGTNIYAGNNSSTIYVINPSTKAVTSTISTSVTNIRWCAYDPTLNGNNGGFHVGTWGTAITQVSMTGTTLGSISAATHGLTGMYGMAYDPYSTGGPYLWAFDQGTSPNQADLVQLNAATGVPTGLVHDVTTDLTNPGIAGGVFICNNFVSGKNSIMGISQGGSLFSYELADPLPNDAQMDAVNMSQYAAAGNLTISGTIRNTGLNTITSVDIVWDAGSGANSQTFPVNISANGTYNFTHGTQLAVTAGTTYNVCTYVVLTGDGNSLNDTLCMNITGLSTIPAKKVVGEEKTGTWCGWCPRGAVGLAWMESQTDFIGIAVHNNDPMVVSAYDGNIGTYIPGGYPGGGVDRVAEGDPNYSSFLAMHNARKTAVVPCEVKNIVAVYNSTSGKISVSADSEWYGSIPGNYRMSCVIVEDNVLSSAQSNYYGAGQAGGPGGTYDNGGPMAFPSGVNNSFDFYGASSSVSASSFLGYDHVARSLSSNNILGDASSLPAGTVTAGTHPYTFADVNTSVVTDWTASHAVVMIINADNGEILNADIAPLTNANSTADLEAAQFNLKVYPNPTEGQTTVHFNLPSQAAVAVDVYNTVGSLVHTQGVQSMGAGQHNLTFDGSDLPAGMYFVNITIDGQVFTQKLSLNK